MAANPIKTALSQLDISNDAHWTADGAPRLDVLKKLAGVAVTRDDIAKAIPEFSRATATAAAAAAKAPDDEGAKPTTPVAPADTPADVQVKPAAEPELSLADEGEVSAQDTARAELAATLAELDEAQKLLLELQKKNSDAARAVQNQMVLVDQLTDKVNKQNPNNTPTEAIMGYLARQQLEREARGDRMNAVRASGVDLKALVASVQRAPIDAAMARKNGRGGNRPKR